LSYDPKKVGVTGFEPANPLDPNQVLYQTELHSDEVSATGFEPAASCTPSKSSTRLSYALMKSG
jgi:hypothetical protein